MTGNNSIQHVSLAETTSKNQAFLSTISLSLAYFQLKVEDLHIHRESKHISNAHFGLFAMQIVSISPTAKAKTALGCNAKMELIHSK